MDWTNVVNETRYFGNARPEGNSSFLDDIDAKEGTPEQDEETTKERNRRLLMQEHTVQAGRKKIRKTKRPVRRFDPIQTLQTVEEDGPVEEPSNAMVLAENDELTTCDCLRELKKVTF